MACCEDGDEYPHSHEKLWNSPIFQSLSYNFLVGYRSTPCSPRVLFIVLIVCCFVSAGSLCLCIFSLSLSPPWCSCMSVCVRAYTHTLQGDRYLIHWDEWPVCISSIQLTLSNSRCLSLSFSPSLSPSPNPAAHWSPLTLLHPHLLFTTRAKDDWHFILQLRGTTKIEETEKWNQRAWFKDEEVEEASLSASICCCRA